MSVPMNAEEKRRLADYFDLGFELQRVDLVRSDEADIRMGTFVQAAAFIDALAQANSAGLPKKAVPGGDSGKWRRFVETFFPSPEYAPVAAEYKGFRCLLVHNFSASSLIGFIHGQPHRHLRREGGGLILDRGSFVAATSEAFDAFRAAALADLTLGKRVLGWLDDYPPIAYWVPPGKPTAPSLGGAIDASGTSHAGTLSLGSTDAEEGRDLEGEGWRRSSDRPHMAPSVKRKPKSR
jgi:hypothetical protein